MNNMVFESSVVLSPFLLGTKQQWAWDSMSLGWLKECPRKYELHMIEGWTLKGEAVDLEFGILYHKALETYDRNIALGHEDALLCAVTWVLGATWRDGKPWRASASLDASDRKSLKCRENLVRTVIWYLDKFRQDKALLKYLPSGQPMVELNFRFETTIPLGDGYYSLCGYIDKVVNFQSLDFAMDRKTTLSTISTSYYSQFDPDNQMTIYTIAGQVAFKTPVKGVIVDAAQVAVGFSRFGRHIVQKTEAQLDEWMKDFGFWMKLNETFVAADYWPMNDKSCHKYGGCSFLSICTRDPSQRKAMLETRFERRPWNPLEIRS